MNRKYVFLLFISVCLMCSCNRLRLGFQVNSMIGREVIIPEQLEYYRGRIDKQYDSTALATIVLWYDSTECSMCKLNALNKLTEIESFCLDSVDNVNIMVVLSPNVLSIESFKDAIELIDFEYPFYLDTCQYFYALNGSLTENKQLHSFLLNRDKRIVLCGDPLISYPLWLSYKSHIIDLVEE